ncbi:MAG: FkbM family methyltransferase, partial [Coxiellaceae bacterium]|nr:FkbM family methyltransferase [Coxiellaceae bacterium]
KKRIYNYKMWLDTTDPGISRTLILFGKREIDHKIMLEQALKPGMTVLDIGANIGYYAMMESQLVSPNGKVIAIEPSPKNIELLKRNVKLNKRDNIITVKAGAVSNTSENREFYLASASNLNTFHQSGSAAQYLTGETVEVATYTVDEIQDEFGKIDLIRMDVEGHEVEIFSGMLPGILSGELSPMIIFETHNSQYNDEHDMRTPLMAMFDAGYRVTLLSSNAEKGTKKINAMGYKPYDIVKTDFVKRALYRDISNVHALDLICESGARTVLLAR